jgi:hypothetical protein
MPDQICQEEYGPIQREFPSKDLLRVPHKNQGLTVTLTPFGPNTFRGNGKRMQEKFSHPLENKQITFRLPTISESISAVAFKFEKYAQPRIANSGILLGYAVQSSSGVFINVCTLNAQDLNKVIDSCSDFIYEGSLDFMDAGFVPFGYLTRGKQDWHTFVSGNFARVLEHTKEKEAPNLAAIASAEPYVGVDVKGFNEYISKPTIGIITLSSYERLFGGRMLSVNFVNEDKKGYTFGVLNER